MGDGRAESHFLFVAQADHRKLFHGRAEQALANDYLLDDALKLFHEATLKKVQQLEKNPAARPLLNAYCEALEASDFDTVTEKLSSLKGTEQIVNVASQNYVKQVDRLLMAGSDLLQKDKTVVRHYGIAKQFHSLQEINRELAKLRTDMQTLATNDQFDDVLSGLEKYMYDGKNLERDEGRLKNGLLIKHPSSESFLPEITEEDTQRVDLPRILSNRNILQKVDLHRAKDWTTNNIFYDLPSIPQTVILEVPSKEILTHGSRDYQAIFVDWHRVPYDQRPQVIMYTPGFKPQLYQKHDYQGFLFCSSEDELHDVLSMTNQLAATQQEHLQPIENLSEKQQEAYDNSDLREWENITADTYKSLKLIIGRIQKRGLSHKPIVDFGTGEGRIGGMLARLGINVLGFDFSSEQLAKSRQRIKEEGEGLRGEDHHDGLSYHALHRLIEEGLIKNHLIMDDDLVTLKYPTVQGEFKHLHYDLNQALIQWKDEWEKGKKDGHFKGADPYVFFDEVPGEYALSDPRDMFLDASFDMALFNWHTFNEVAAEDQTKVLEQILNVMSPGGELIIEIPDRNIEPYASALEIYHVEHPDEPYGTIRDPRPDGGEPYPPRYFPDINELILKLKSVGYEIDPEQDIQSYLITGKAPNGEETLTLKEFFITARKSKQ